MKWESTETCIIGGVDSITPVGYHNSAEGAVVDCWVIRKRHNFTEEEKQLPINKEIVDYPERHVMFVDAKVWDLLHIGDGRGKKKK